MPTKDRTRRPAPDEVPFDGLFDGHAPGDEDAAQRAARSLARRLESEFRVPDAEAWEGSPYAWMRNLSASQKGRAAETLVARLLTDAGLQVQPPATPGHSLRLGENRIKIRLSLRWASGNYVFQQVDHGDWDTLVLFGISPAAAHAWALRRADLHGHVDGSVGWIQVPASCPPDWLHAHGPELLKLTSTLSHPPANTAANTAADHA